MSIQFKVRKDYELSGRMMVHETDYPTFEARLAMRFAEIILQASDYGKIIGNALAENDSPAKMVAVETICKRACAVAEYLAIEMRRREWVVQSPNIDDVYPDAPKRDEV